MLAVGHSYGGAVITNAATQADNVVGLVYVAAFAPDEGERLGEVEAGSKDSVLARRWFRTSIPTRTAERQRSSRSTRRRPATRLRATSPTRRRR